MNEYKNWKNNYNQVLIDYSKLFSSTVFNYDDLVFSF